MEFVFIFVWPSLLGIAHLGLLVKSRKYPASEEKGSCDTLYESQSMTKSRSRLDIDM